MKLRLSGLMALFLLTFLISQAKLTPANLTCEYMSNPTVVDVLQPRLAWVNIASEGERGQRQTAWQVRVASSPEKLDSPDLWDSGRVPGDESNRMVYAGKPLQSRMECWWQVQIGRAHV